MKTFKLKNGDLVMEGGDIQIIDGSEELAQNIFVGLSTFKNEWFFDPELGIDAEKIRGKPTDAQMRSTIIEELGKEPRIDLIEEIEIRRDMRARTANIYFRAQTVDGDVIEGEVNDFA